MGVARGATLMRQRRDFFKLFESLLGLIITKIK